MPEEVDDSIEPDVWLDVEPLLQRAAAAMTPGQLLHGDSFSLFESVTAVEIGNVRMDAAADREVRSADELLAAGGAPLVLPGHCMVAVMDQLLCLEAAWHCGHFLPQSVYTCLYMLLPHRTDQMLPLAAYCKALRATCNTARSLTLVSNVCMDEDIMPHAFGLDVEDRSHCVSGSYKALAALTFAEDQLTSSKGSPSGHSGIHGNSNSNSSDSSSGGGGPRATASQSTQQAALGDGHNMQNGVANTVQQAGATITSSVEPAAAASSPQNGDETASAPAARPSESSQTMALNPAVQDALLARLRFRRAFHQVLEKLLAFCVTADLQEAAAQIRAAQTHLTDIRSTASSAAAADDPIVDKCFDAAVNRPLMTPTPPRRMPVPDQKECWEHFDALLLNLLAVCRISEVSSWRQLQMFLHEFRDRRPGHIERAALHLVLRGGKAAGNGTPPPSAPPWTPRPAMTAAVVSLPSGSHAAQPCEEATVFLEQATIVTQNWCQAMCLNGSRGRRRLRALFEDWGHLHGHASVAESTPEVVATLQEAGWKTSDAYPGVLATWVESETAAMMVHSLLEGCPLDLYTPREFPALYWYCDYLLAVLLEGQLALAESAPRADSLSPSRNAAASALGSQNGKAPGSGKRSGKTRKGSSTGAGTGTGKQPGARKGASAAGITQPAATNKAGRKAAAAQAERLRSEAEQRHALLSIIDVERQMCQGTFRAATGSRMLGHLPEPANAPPGSEALRYEQRFGAFSVITHPELLTYDQYLEATNPSGVNPGQLFQLAGQSLQHALDRVKALLACRLSSVLSPHEVKMLRCLQKTAQQNVAALRIMATALDADPGTGLQLTWSFKHHPHYPTLSIKR